MDTTVVVVVALAAGWFVSKLLKARATAKREAEIERTKWRHDDEAQEVEVDFPTMICTIEEDLLAWMDGDGVYQLDKRAKSEWEKNEEELKNDGWTRTEYIRRGRTCYDLRRKGDGTWERRMLDKYWTRAISRAKAAMLDERYKHLTGEDWDVAKEREDATAVLYARAEKGEISLHEANEQARALRKQSTQYRSPPWETLGDLERLLETAYQRYIHHR